MNVNTHLYLSTALVSFQEGDINALRENEIQDPSRKPLDELLIKLHEKIIELEKSWKGKKIPEKIKVEMLDKLSQTKDMLRLSAEIHELFSEHPEWYNTHEPV